MRRSTAGARAPPRSCPARCGARSPFPRRRRRLAGPRRALFRASRCRSRRRPDAELGAQRPPRGPPRPRPGSRPSRSRRSPTRSRRTAPARASPRRAPPRRARRCSWAPGAGRRRGRAPPRPSAARSPSSSGRSTTRSASTPASAASRDGARLAADEERVVVAEEDDPARSDSVERIARRDAERWPSRPPPAAIARWLARAMTGPSAMGSLNGTPSSRMSAPASTHARARSMLSSTLGSPTQR